MGLLRALVLLCAMSLISACGKATYRWKEEVLLHDGRVIVIERSVRTGDVPVEIGQEPGDSDYTLKFETDAGKTASWDGGKSFRPMVFDQLEGEAFVVATGRTGADYERHGCPRPPYFFFRHRVEKWERISYESMPREIRKRNLLNGPTTLARKQSREAVRRGYATLDDVRKSLVGLSNHYKEVREDAPNPCANWGDPMKYESTSKDTGASK